jgi:hypothetical protein
MIPDWKEIRRNIAASVKIVFGRREGIAELDLTASGFWRSFYALFLTLPISLANNILDYRSSLQRGTLDASGSMFSQVAVQMMASLLSYLVSLLVIYAMARSIKVLPRFPISLIALNWGSLALAILSFPFVVMLNSVTGTDPASINPLLPILVMALMVGFTLATFNIIRLTLQITFWPAALFVFVANVFEITTFFAVLQLFGI